MTNVFLSKNEKEDRNENKRYHADNSVLEKKRQKKKEEENKLEARKTELSYK